MQAETLRVVLDEDLTELLDAIGLRQKIEDGEILCEQCGTPISLSTVGMLLHRQAGGYSLTCTNSACIERQLASRGAADAKC